MVTKELQDQAAANIAIGIGMLIPTCSCGRAECSKEREELIEQASRLVVKDYLRRSKNIALLVVLAEVLDIDIDEE